MGGSSRLTTAFKIRMKTVEAELRNEQLELYRQQFQVYHLLTETSVGLTGTDPINQKAPSSKWYRRRLLHDTETSRRFELKSSENVVVEYTDDEGALRDHDCVRPFILGLISATCEEDSECQATLIATIEQTLRKRRVLVEDVVRCGGLKVIRHMLERSALQSDKSLLRLVIEMIQSLPLILEAVKDSKLPRVLKRLTAELDIPEEVRAAASELLDQWTAAAKQPVPGHVAKVSNTSRAEGPDDRPGKRAKQGPPSVGAGNISVISEAPIVDIGRENLIRLGGPMPELTKEGRRAGAGSSKADVDAALASGLGLITASDETASGAPLPLKARQAKKGGGLRNVTWADVHGGRALVDIRVFERDEGEAGARRKKGSMKELAKWEHLSERDSIRKEKNALTGVLRERLIQVGPQGWKRPRSLQGLKGPESHDLTSSERRVQTARLRNIFEVSYMREGDIPSTPQEQADAVHLAAPYISGEAALSVIPFEPLPDHAAAEIAPTSSSYSPPPLFATPGAGLGRVDVSARTPSATHPVLSAALNTNVLLALLHNPTGLMSNTTPQAQSPVASAAAYQAPSRLAVAGVFPNVGPHPLPPSGPQSLHYSMASLLGPVGNSALSTAGPLLGGDPPHQPAWDTRREEPYDDHGLLPHGAQQRPLSERPRSPPRHEGRDGGYGDQRSGGRRHCAFFNAHRRVCRNDPCRFIHDRDHIPEPGFPTANRRDQERRDRR